MDDIEMEDTTEQANPGYKDGDGDDDDEDDDDGDDNEEEEANFPELINNDDIKKGSGMVSGVCRGWTKVGRDGKLPVIQLGPNSSPTFRTQKASQFDGIIDDDPKFNLSKQRRATVRNKDDTLRFALSNVKGIKAVSYYVPDEYEGNPAALLLPYRKLTKKEKEKMKQRGEEVPEEPEPVVVQVLVEWKEEYKKKRLSWETRGGIRRLYRDDFRGDKFIYKAALEQEANYEEYLTGRRPDTSKSPELFAPGRENTVPPPGGPGGQPLPGGPAPPPGNRAEKAAAFEEFKEDYAMLLGSSDFTNLTPAQAADAIEAFRLFWSKRMKAAS
jgi:hypothetical protein